MVSKDPESGKLVLDSEEVEMALFGFAGKLCNHPSRAIFFEDMREANSTLPDTAHSLHPATRNLLTFVDPTIAKDLALAFDDYTEKMLDNHFLNTDPPINPKLLLFKNAEAEKAKAQEAAAFLRSPEATA